MTDTEILVRYLEEKGNTEVKLIGAFFQWKSKSGENGAASFSDVQTSWKNGR